MQRQSKIYTAVVSFLVATRKTLEKIAQNFDNDFIECNNEITALIVGEILQSIYKTFFSCKPLLRFPSFTMIWRYQKICRVKAFDKNKKQLHTEIRCAWQKPKADFF